MGEFAFFLRTHCYFEDILKEVLSPFVPPFSSKPSVSLAPASESSLMQFSKLFAWATTTKLSPLQNRKMKVVAVEMDGVRGSETHKNNTDQRIPFKLIL